MPQVLVKSIFSAISLVLLAGMAAFAQTPVATPVTPALPLTAPAAVEDPQTKVWEKPLTRCWSIDDESLFDVPSVSNKGGFLFIALPDGAVSALDSASGKQAWDSTLGGRIEALKLTENGKVFVTARQEVEESEKPPEKQGEKTEKPPLVLHALSEESGITVWRKEFDLTGEVDLLTDSTGLYLLSDTGEMIAVNPATGDVIWRSNAGAKIVADPAITEKSIFLGLAEKKIVEISRESGKIVQNYAAQVELSGPMLVSDGQLIYSDSVGNIVSRKLSTGEYLWKARAGAGVTDITMTAQGLLVSSNDNFAYMLHTTRGDRKWKKKFPGRLQGKPVLIEKYGLFVPSSGREAAILNLTDGKAVNLVPLIGEAYFTGSATGAATATLSGFSLSTSQGTAFYSATCTKK